MSLSVEYLAIFQRTDSFCDSVESLTRLLQVDSKIKITSGEIRYDGVITCRFQISRGEVAGKQQRYFHLKISWNDGPGEAAGSINHLDDLLKAIRRAVASANGDTETLWDDLSAHYATKSYPLIHEIENLMRRLIANFMLVTVGRDWVSESLPHTVKDAVQKSKRQSNDKDYLNALHRIDFIDLGDILFTPYPTRDIEKLYQFIQAATAPVDPSALQEFLPKSNWQRYFGALVTCEDSYLHNRWKKLYALRCKVAHNASMRITDFEELERLIADVKPKFQEAIAKLSNVTVPPDEVDALAEGVARRTNAVVGEFIMTWQQLESAIVRRLASHGGDSHRIPTAHALTQHRILDEADAAVYDEMRHLRNSLVHGPTVDMPLEVLQQHVASLHMLLETASESNYIEHLHEMSEEDREAAIEGIINRKSFKLVDSESMCDIMSSTNAAVWDVDEISLTNTDFNWQHGRCVAHFRFRASGEQLDEKMCCGTRIHGEADAIIDVHGYVEFDNVIADLDDDGDFDPPT